MKNICKIIFLSLLTSVLCLPTSFSQTVPGIEWQNTIGGSGADLLYSIRQTPDGGYILGGFSQSNISGDKTENSIGFDDFWIVKADSAGNIQWQNTIGANDFDVVTAVKHTFDGGYILGGTSNSSISGDKTENCIGSWDYWIVKTDSIGNIQWQNTIGGNNSDYLYSIQQTADGGYILGGSSGSPISGDKTEMGNGVSDFWIVKTDSLGNIKWQNTIGGSHNDYLQSIQQTSDNGYILGGHSASNISGDKSENNLDSTQTTYDYWIVKTDSLGNVQWQNTMGGSSEDDLYSISQTSDGGYILGGFSNSGISGDKSENSNGLADLWIVKTDSAGNILWQNTIGGTGDDVLRSIIQTNDGGYILGASSNSVISGDKTENCIGMNDYWIVKTDLLGNIQWQNTIGGNSNDFLRSVQQLTDGGFILGGYSASNISGDKTENCIGNYDYWIIKLEPDTITSIFNIQPSIFNIQISPNPLTTQSKLTFKNPNKEKFFFTLCDITGRMTETISTITNEILLTKSSKQPGVYLFNLVNEKTGERRNGKIVIAK
jgi:hypothetical protein